MRSATVKLVGLAAIGALWLAMPCAASAQTPQILPGPDFFETEPLNTTAEVNVPAGFLGRNASTSGPAAICAGVNETVHFGGVPEDPRNHGDADTIVERLNAGTPFFGQQVQVPIRIVSLHLRSMEPLKFECGGETQQWQVDFGLTPNQLQGQMVIAQTSAGGGTFSSTLPVTVRSTFTRVDDSAVTKTLDLPPVFLGSEDVPWTVNCRRPVLVLPGINAPPLSAGATGVEGQYFCPGLTPQGQKVLTVEQSLLARHGVYPAQPSLEHFQCYKLEKTKFKERKVSLNDQFKNRKKVKVSERKDLCNPAKKNKEPFLNKRAHLTRYSIDGRAINVQVATLNQFGSQRLLVKKPKLLMVPTEKQEGDRRKKIDAQIDHFQCYSIKTKSGIRSVDGKPKRVTLKDQFRKKGVKVKGPKLLCAPVDKNKEGLLHPVRHLLCYPIEAKRISKRVTIRNQFEREGVTVEKPKELCVPTLKQVITDPVEVVPTES